MGQGRPYFCCHGGDQAALGLGAVYGGGAANSISVYVSASVYAFRGCGKYDFWRFDVGEGAPAPGGIWAILPPADFPEKVKKGGALTTDGGDNIYALRGEDKNEVWRYHIGRDGWDKGPFLPDKVKEGGAITFVGGDIHVMPGRNKKDFWKLSPLPPFAGP